MCENKLDAKKEEINEHIAHTINSILFLAQDV